MNGYAYHSTDGSHLRRDSAEAMSSDLAARIAATLDHAEPTVTMTPRPLK